MKAFRLRSLYGKNYVESEWLGDVYDFKMGELHFFKATVSPSQPGVGRTDYKVWTAVSDFCIQTGYCSCPAGSGRSCSHIAAVLYAVIMAWDYGIARKTCTDKQRLWGRGSSKVLSCHDEFADIVVENSVKMVKCDDKVSKPHQFLDHQDMKPFVTNSQMKPLWECKGTMLNKILNAPEKTIMEKAPLVHGQHDVNTEQPATPSCACCKLFFDKDVAVGKNRITVLPQDTLEQSSSLWLDSRKVRLISSKIHSLPKTSRGNPGKFVTSHIYNRFKGCAATRHGQKYEPVARQWFQQKTGLSVRQSGIVVREEEQYLAASPDGVIDANTIVEIKCPTKPLQELIQSGKYDVCVGMDGEPCLNPKGKNGYYTQVQMAMYCTKTSLCKFIVWKADEQLVLNVKFSEEFVINLLTRVRLFYFKHLLVRLTDEHHFGRLELSHSYRKLCK